MKSLLEIFAPLSTSSPDFENQQGSGRCTQVQMAERLGLDRSYLADLEPGKRNNISILNLEVIARSFGFSLSKLLIKVQG
jgi:transcriptional regulator with XRE-family HTH domain